MKNDEDEYQITDLAMKIIFIFNTQMGNNYNSAKFGMQKYTYDMLGILAKSIRIFV